MKYLPGVLVLALALGGSFWLVMDISQDNTRKAACKEKVNEQCQTEGWSPPDCMAQHCIKCGRYCPR